MGVCTKKKKGENMTEFKDIPEKVRKSLLAHSGAEDINNPTEDDQTKVEVMYHRSNRVGTCNCNVEQIYCHLHNRLGKAPKACNLDEGCESCQ